MDSQYPARVWWLAPATTRLGLRHLFQHQRERFHQRFEPLVGAPMPDGKDALLRIAALAEVRRSAAAGANVPWVPSSTFCAEYLLMQRAAIAGQQHGD